MNKLSQNRVILILVTGLVIASFSFFGIVKNIQAENFSSIKTHFVNMSASNIVFNNIVKGIFSGDSKNKVPLNKKDKEENNFFNNFYFFLSILILKEKGAILLLLIFVGFIGKKNSFKEHNKVEAVFIARMKFYLWWALRFLTPLQKCILNRADEFDINPVRIEGGVCLRQNLDRALNYESAVFFMYK